MSSQPYLEKVEALRVSLDREIEAYQNLYDKIDDIPSLREKVRKGYAVYPLNVRTIEYSKLGQVVVVVEKPAYWPRTLSNGSLGRLYSVNTQEYINISVGKLYEESARILLSSEETPEWIKGGKLALLIRPDERSFKEMERALDILEQRENEALSRVFRISRGEEFIADEVEFNLDQLNDSQNKAVSKILSNEPLVAVHGPPGTGKTTTLVAAIVELVKQNKRILVATPSNAAADHITRQLLDHTKKVVRIGNPERVDEELNAVTLATKVKESEEAKLIKDYQKEIDQSLKKANTFKRNFGPAERQERNALRNEVKLLRKQVRALEEYAHKNILNSARIATGTLIGLCTDNVKQQHWDVVVIDEAAQSFEPACWAVASFAERLIIAGDHKQLPPTIVQNLGKEEYSTILDQVATFAPGKVAFLNTQYRMHSNIVEFSNHEFYDGKLITEANRSEENPLVFVDTAGCGYEEEVKEGSKFNVGEVQLVTNLFDEEQEQFKTIGIISPYARQVELLKEALKGKLGNKDVQTIDGFQGQERELIVISLVRSNVEGVIGFLKDYRRMNVAMTRAQQKLIIIGDSSTIGQDSFYNRFLEHVEANGQYRTAWEWF